MTPTSDIHEMFEPQRSLGKISDQSFASAYQKGFQQTVRFLSSRGVPRDDAFDSAQGAWVKAWERREQLRNPSFVLTWVNSIALNVYRTTLRRARHTEALVDRAGTKEDMMAPAIDAERLLQQCGDKDRIVLEGHYIAGFRLGEIAEQNNWSETAARIRLLRARKRLRTALQGRTKKPCALAAAA
jgi:RNA polymerase sigma factor (sigma-70 family)